MINAGDRIGCVTKDYFYLEWLGRQTALYAYDSLGDNPVDISKEQLSQIETAPPQPLSPAPNPHTIR